MDLYYVIEENGYHIYDKKDSLFHIHQFEPYIPDPEKSYEENAKEQIARLLAAAEESNGESLEVDEFEETEQETGMEAYAVSDEGQADITADEAVFESEKHKVFRSSKELDVVKIILAVLLAVTLISFCITVKNHKGTVNYYSNTVNTLNQQITELSASAENYSRIAEAYASGNVGWASPNFRLSNGLVHVKKGASASVTLYTGIGGKIYPSNSNEAVANIAFQQTSWSGSVSLTVNGYASGTSVVTFTNSVNSDELRLIILVTE